MAFFDEYRAVQVEEFYALNEGPPAATALESFNANQHIGYLDEVHVEGQILANFGVLRLHGEGADYDGIVLGTTDGVPRAVVLFDSLSSDREINQLISTATADNRVAVRGFVTSTRRTEVEREITRRGFSGRAVLTVEPFFGSRTAAINAQVQDAQILFFIVTGVAALFAVLALWRFRRWRKRRAAKKLRRAAKRGQPLPATPPQTAVKPQPKPQKSQPATPWGTPQQPPQHPRPTPAARTKPHPEPEASTQAPPFKSVFPGGGSGFRFKTSDEIVRQYFGTITNISRSNSSS